MSESSGDHEAKPQQIADMEAGLGDAFIKMLEADDTHNLPPGADALIKNILSGGEVSPEDRKKIEEHLKFLAQEQRNAQKAQLNSADEVVNADTESTEEPEYGPQPAEDVVHERGLRRFVKRIRSVFGNFFKRFFG